LAALTENFTLYLSRNQEEFAPFVAPVFCALWAALLSKSSNIHADKAPPPPPVSPPQFVCGVMRYITGVASSASPLLAAPEAVRDVVGGVGVPQLRLSAADEELFDDNPLEFVRRDIDAAADDKSRGGGGDGSDRQGGELRGTC
jgi:exportin-2 (importin alpha re-exporter)